MKKIWIKVNLLPSFLKTALTNKISPEKTQNNPNTKNIHKKPQNHNNQKRKIKLWKKLSNLNQAKKKKRQRNLKKYQN